MAEESQYSASRPDSKRKFDDGPCPPPPPPTYNSVPPPLDGIQLAKLKAQEIASKLFNEVEAKRPKVDNGAAGDDHVQKPLGQQVPSQMGMTQPTFSSPYGYGTSKKIEIPNGRVGVIIGKSGDTIKYLQQQSGAKIQVTRDMDADPHSQTRPVELMGTPEQINRAEQLINEVLSEAEAGGAGVTNRKFGGIQSGGEHFSMKIPNNKVGLIIGKGGETIKNMQANSGARIQVIPLHLPPGDPSMERTLHIDGTPDQIEAAKKLVYEIINSEKGSRNPQMGGAYPQQGYRPPRPPVNWGPPGPPVQQAGYGYMQPGAYPGAPPQYMSQPPYGGYQAQPPASGGYSSGWDQSSTQGAQQPASTTGYDYYNQQQLPTSASADNTGYNYGQPQPAYSQGAYGDASYSQTADGQQQSYTQDYSGAYNAQAPQSGYSQPTATPQTGYDQQSYGSAPAYGAANPPQDGSVSTYGAPSGTTTVTPSQQAPPAVQPSPTQQGYTGQPPSATPTSYPPQGTAQAGYGVPPTTQPGYGQSPAVNQPSYGQSPQGQKPQVAQAVYGQPPTSQAGYAVPSQPGYAQPPPGQSAYGQQYQQVPPYGSAPQTAQPAYGQQQSYGDSYGSGGYSQPPSYGSEGSAGAAAPGGATQASPQS